MQIGQLNEARSTLQDLKIDNAKEIIGDAELRTELEVLESRLIQKEVARPIGAFALDHSTSAASLGLMVTYMLVLFQFKASEN